MEETELLEKILVSNVLILANQLKNHYGHPTTNDFIRDAIKLIGEKEDTILQKIHSM